ncbi:MAG: cation:proton antiporter, partial [Longimicrobiales bacterium]
MGAIAVLLAAAAVGFGLARWWRVPALPILLLAGAATDAFIELPEAVVTDAVVLGVTFLVFVAGVELNPARVGQQRAAATRVGIVQFVGLGGAGLLVSLALGFGRTESLYLALALTASSTLVIVRILQQRQQMFEPFGRLVLGVLLLQDLLVILLIPIVTRLPRGPFETAVGIVAALGLTGLALLCYRYATRRVVSAFVADQETLLLVVLAVLFGFIGLSAVVGLPMVAGAFLAGLALSPFPVNGIVRAELASIADFFLAILFTALGALLVIPSGGALTASLALAATVLLVTPPLVALLAERAGLSARAGIESGLLLAQASEFSLVVGLHGMVEGQISQETFTIIALVVVLTMILTPLLGTDTVTWRLMRLHPLRHRAMPETPPRDHVLLLGCGESGMPLLETIAGSGMPVLVVDDDAAIVERLREGDVACLRGDGSDMHVLERAGAKRARLIISTIRRAADNEAILRYAPGVPTLVRV